MNHMIWKLHPVSAIVFDAQGTRVPICRPSEGFAVRGRGICKIPEVLIT